LNELLVYFRSVDVGEKFAVANASADVVIPLFEIAAGTGVDRFLWRAPGIASGAEKA
jgi:hypothetical protein